MMLKGFDPQISAASLADIGPRLVDLHYRVIGLRQSWAAGGAPNSVGDVDLQSADVDLPSQRGLPLFINGEVQMSRAGTERLLEHMVRDMPQ